MPQERVANQLACGEAPPAYFTVSSFDGTLLSMKENLFYIFTYIKSLFSLF